MKFCCMTDGWTFSPSRTRWISEDLDQMKKRLIQFALERYWRSSMPER
jgi:hypothetical protein